MGKECPCNFNWKYEAKWVWNSLRNGASVKSILYGVAKDITASGRHKDPQTVFKTTYNISTNRHNKKILIADGYDPKKPVRPTSLAANYYFDKKTKKDKDMAKVQLKMNWLQEEAALSLSEGQEFLSLALAEGVSKVEEGVSLQKWRRVGNKVEQETVLLPEVSQEDIRGLFEELSQGREVKGLKNKDNSILFTGIFSDQQNSLDLKKDLPRLLEKVKEKPTQLLINGQRELQRLKPVVSHEVDQRSYSPFLLTRERQRYFPEETFSLRRPPLSIIEPEKSKKDQLFLSPSLLFFPAAFNLTGGNDKKPFLSTTSQRSFELIQPLSERKEPLLRQATKKENLMPQVAQPERKLSRRTIVFSRKETSSLGAKFAESLKGERQESIGSVQQTEVDTTQGLRSIQPLRLESERNELPQGVKGPPPLRWKRETKKGTPFLKGEGKIFQIKNNYQEIIVFETPPNPPSFRNHEERIKSGKVVSEEPEVKTVKESLTKYRDRVILSEEGNKSGPNQTSVKTVSIEANLSVNREDSRREIKPENSVYIKGQKDKKPPEGLEPVRSLERDNHALENKEEVLSETPILNNLFRTFPLVVERKVAPQNELRMPVEQHHQKIEESFVFPSPLLLEVEPVNEPSRRLSLFNPQGLIVFYQALLYFQFSQIMILAILYILRDLAGEEFTVTPSVIPCLENEIVLEYC